jgi:hypothetical protein
MAWCVKCVSRKQSALRAALQAIIRPAGSGELLVALLKFASTFEGAGKGALVCIFEVSADRQAAS